MLDTVIDIASWILVASGSAFVLIGAIGLVRMPDLYTRMHAASVIETLGAGLLILGMILQAGVSFEAMKLVFIFAIFFFVGPVASHALAQAALHENVKPILTEDRRGRLGAPPAQSPDAQPPSPLQETE